MTKEATILSNELKLFIVAVIELFSILTDIMAFSI